MTKQTISVEYSSDSDGKVKVNKKLKKDKKKKDKKEKKHKKEKTE